MSPRRTGNRHRRGAADLARPGLCLLASLVLLVAGCGEFDEPSGEAEEGSRGELTENTEATTIRAEPSEDLPPRPSGRVELEGETDGSLVQRLDPRFDEFADRTGLAVTLGVRDTEEAAGFSRLCAGEIDLVASSRRITADELNACRRNGLQVVDFKLGFDALVVATKNETDVGADCVDFAQLRQIFGEGSSASAWSQVDPSFFPVQLSVAGPGQDQPDFDLFGSRVLGVPDPTLSSFRPDYRPFAREQDIRTTVVQSRGNVGILGFSYYELYEEQLRPLEIDGQAGDRCVFPSEETISADLYPLSRTLRLYTTQRSLSRQEVQESIRFFLQNAERAANEVELIPLPDALRDAEQDKITNPVESTPAGREETGAVISPEGG